MGISVLVAYATRSGSTTEVAQAIVKDLREQGIAAEIQPAKAVKSLEQFGALVLAVPLYMFRFHRDARRFLSRHRAQIMRMPAALVVLGPIQKEEKDWIAARGHLDKELRKYPWLSPLACELIGGRFDPAQLGFPYTLIPALRNMPASDLRDWAAIHTLAGDLAAKFLPALR